MQPYNIPCEIWVYMHDSPATGQRRPHSPATCQFAWLTIGNRSSDVWREGPDHSCWGLDWSKPRGGYVSLVNQSDWEILDLELRALNFWLGSLVTRATVEPDTQVVGWSCKQTLTTLEMSKFQIANWFAFWNYHSVSFDTFQNRFCLTCFLKLSFLSHCSLCFCPIRSSKC